MVSISSLPLGFSFRERISPKLGSLLTYLTFKGDGDTWLLLDPMVYYELKLFFFYVFLSLSCPSIPSLLSPFLLFFIRLKKGKTMGLCSSFLGDRNWACERRGKPRDYALLFQGIWTCG
ncbi:hypothetical protein RchiOBHm_Chr2g0124001 [Rosa chinensis]|uniref:Uncharacterized protein n=1 Tax=Rosa chinensis TaxID=74649 RepID=A0A2P6RT66_ROSCH|nr:hypothetical protein RchiOBHm_Chr2g0124001 [Rosa chinensis]